MASCIIEEPCSTASMIVSSILTELYLLQNGNTPLHYAIFGIPIDCLERLLSTPGIDVTIIMVQKIDYCPLGTYICTLCANKRMGA